MTAPTDESPRRDPAAPPRLHWDVSDLSSTRCDVASATDAGTQVVLNFGVNRAQGQTSAEIGVELRHRIVLDLVAAKRLQDLLTRVIAEHEASRAVPK